MRKLASLNQPYIAHAARIIEPELDMRRMHPHISAFDRIFSWVQKLMPPKDAGPPRRAIARELEEVWPAADRG